jgi:hypothetical protein
MAATSHLGKEQAEWTMTVRQAPVQMATGKSTK